MARPGLWCGPCAAHLCAVLVSIAARVVCCLVVGCVVCGWCVSSCGVRVAGYPLCAPPCSWWWVGALWMVGWHGEVGWHGGGRAGAATLTLPSNVGVPSRLYWCAPSRWLSGCVEWRAACAVMPVFGLVRHLRVVLLLSYHLRFSFVCVWWHDAMRGGGGVCYEWRRCGLCPALCLFPSVFVFAVTALLV